MDTRHGLRLLVSRICVVVPLSAACLGAGCGSASVTDVQKRISKGLNEQLSSQGLESEEHVSAVVTCPKNASLKAGSVFYCDAKITKFPLNAPPLSNSTDLQTTRTETRKVMVTIERSNKAHWVLT